MNIKYGKQTIIIEQDIEEFVNSMPDAMQKMFVHHLMSKQLIPLVDDVSKATIKKLLKENKDLRERGIFYSEMIEHVRETQI